MLQVTNGVVTLRVTKGAFKSFYKNRGFRPVGGAYAIEDAGVVTTHDTSVKGHPDNSSQQEIEDDDAYDEDEEDEIDLSEIPLVDMSFQQLHSYADQLDLDHEGIRSKKELRAMIRNHLKK